MGNKNKLKRFEENKTFSNVIQPDRKTLKEDNFKFKGLWQENYFKNNHPIVLELGCGKGEYTLALAKEYPNKNFIGIDIKGARFWRGAKIAIQENLSNVAFLRIQIELLNCAFSPKEVDEIWITFPDPQIKYKRTKHRLTNETFLDKYKTVLKDKGKVHLKTDSSFLYGYTLGLLHGLGYTVLYSHHDIYNNSYAPKEATTIQTFYEQYYLNQKKAITYSLFELS